MGSGAKEKTLFTASELAAFCQVDLKTIHNWADRGEMRHFRTPGRHLRFRREDVIDFLRRYGYPIPPNLVAARPRLLVVAPLGRDEPLMRMLSPGHEVVEVTSPLEALLQIGASPPDAVLVPEQLVGVAAVDWIAAIKNAAATRHVRVLAIGTSRDEHASLLGAGASAHLAAEPAELVVDALRAMLGGAR
ncbi:MAG: helix-turn-helix domain-containing protein [Myxococcales bacterium]|nr:helix-turn-helix domain-containing protein [Myxococcales bacterium]